MALLGPAKVADGRERDPMQLAAPDKVEEDGYQRSERRQSQDGVEESDHPRRVRV
jgi:hypothetical protein